MSEKWALVSVFNKEGVAEDACRLVKMGWSIISSGGTAKVLADAGIPVTDVAKLVGGGAILGHRVVTLSREVHAALLADALKPEDLAELVDKNIPFIDLVRCDFYPLREAIADPKATIDSVVEKTDIGGPCMVRSGAKGLRIVVCRQQDMELVLQELEKTGDVSPENRQELRARAEFEVAKYAGESAMYHGTGRFRVIAGERVAEFKGENGPQTPAVLFSTTSNDPLALDEFKVIEGASPSYNNWCDVDRLLQTMTHMAAAWELNWGRVPYIAIGVKHGNPCGAAVADSLEQTAWRMVKGDTRAIFGGLLMTNFPVTGEVADAMANAMPDGKARFDGVIAPSFDADARNMLSRAKGKCRLITNLSLAEDSALLDMTPRFRYVRGGLLTQPAYSFVLNLSDPEITKTGELSGDHAKDLVVAWGVGCTSNSNTITVVKDGMLIGNGVGQQDRVGAAELAVKRAVDAEHKADLQDAVAYSDSFFPFPDAVEVLINAGIRTIFSTTGSVNDGIIQKLCADKGAILVQLPDSKARGFFGH